MDCSLPLLHHQLFLATGSFPFKHVPCVLVLKFKRLLLALSLRSRVSYTHQLRSLPLTHPATHMQLHVASTNTAVARSGMASSSLRPADTFQSTSPLPSGGSARMAQRLTRGGGSALRCQVGSQEAGGQGKWGLGASQGSESRDTHRPLHRSARTDARNDPAPGAICCRAEAARLALQHLRFLLKIHPFE